MTYHLTCDNAIIGEDGFADDNCNGKPIQIIESEELERNPKESSLVIDFEDSTEKQQKDFKNVLEDMEQTGCLSGKCYECLAKYLEKGRC